MLDFLGFLAERRHELLSLTGQHLVLVLAATALAATLGVPLGILMSRSERVARPLLAAAGLAQTIPSLALFGFLIPLPLIGGIGARTAIVALVVYALLPILRNTYVGIRQVDPAVREAAQGLGMTDVQLLRRVDLPLAMPVILAGLRIAAVTSVGTATIAAAIGAGGLGTYVFRGIARVDTRLILAGAVPAAALALIVDGLLARVEKSQRPGRSGAIVLTLTLGALLVLLLAGRERVGPPVRVGSKNFTEQLLLGEIVAGLLESRGLPVERRLDLGGTALCHGGLLSGQLDLYVEYTGTALVDILKRPSPREPAAALLALRAEYERLGLTVGEPLGFNNSFALVVRPTDAERLGLRRISDLRAHASTLRVGLSGEFLERADGMKGLNSAYGFTFTRAPREMDLGLLYQALLAEEVDVVVGSATDGLIAARGLVVLEDDRGYFPPYDAVPIMRTAILMERPELREILVSLGGQLDAPTMRRLNHAVDGERRPARAVARDFLRTLRN
jgi:osmoprotectant transport system permease protein